METPQLDVRYVAKLARLALSEEEIDTFQQQLGQVLEHVRQLEQVDVTGIEPMAHAQALENVFREDVERPSLPVEKVLANAPKQSGDLIVVTKVVE